MTFSQDEAAAYLGVGVPKLKSLESLGLVKLPVINRYAKDQLDAFVQFLINEQKEGWKIPSGEAGERENDLRVLESEPGRSGSRPRTQTPKATGHPLDRSINVA